MMHKLLMLCSLAILMSINLYAQNTSIKQKELLLAIPQEFYYVDPDQGGILTNDWLISTFLLEYTEQFSWLTTTVYVSGLGDYYDLYDKYRDTIFAIKPKDAYIPWTTGGNTLASTEILNLAYLDCSKYWTKKNDLLFGRPAFELYKATIQYIELGQETLKVPNYQYKSICRKKTKDFYMHSYQVNAITNVLEVKAITQVEAEEWLSQ